VSGVDAVELMSRRAQLFALRAELSDRASSEGKSAAAVAAGGALRFPTFVWVAQDFVQDLGADSADAWLERLLGRPHHRVDHMVDGSNARSSLRDIFASVHCRTLFLPATAKDKLMRLDRVDKQPLPNARTHTHI
jgi:Guanylate-binding protein, N-terminal domain